jgi:4-amino-4-deoxyprephenate dehydrogenase
VAESPEVYFEIQAANPHAAGAVARLRTVLDRLADIVARGDAVAFAELMREGSERTGG